MRHSLLMSMDTHAIYVRRVMRSVPAASPLRVKELRKREIFRDERTKPLRMPVQAGI